MQCGHCCPVCFRVLPVASLRPSPSVFSPLPSAAWTRNAEPHWLARRRGVFSDRAAKNCRLIGFILRTCSDKKEKEKMRRFSTRTWLSRTLLGGKWGEWEESKLIQWECRELNRDFVIFCVPTSVCGSTVKPDKRRENSSATLNWLYSSRLEVRVMFSSSYLLWCVGLPRCGTIGVWLEAASEPMIQL